jgi:hypothetical protein
MIRNLKIEHRIAQSNLGETDDDFAAEYVDALQARLKEEYPGAEIEVNLNSDFANACQTFVAGDDDDGCDSTAEIRQNVDDIANLVWERMC